MTESSAARSVDHGSSGGDGGPSVRGRSPISIRVSAELEKLDQELAEIAMLVGQASEETERHEDRRAKGEERIKLLEADPRPNLEALREARVQLMALTRRELLFDAQREVLEGKFKTLQRYRASLARIVGELSGVEVGDAVERLPGPAAKPALSAGALGSSLARTDRVVADSAAVMRAQEDLRRDIARQMHDGPAQSLANIALQSEIVERLVTRGDPRSPIELAALRRMVQSTLTATKDFIFDVRPMVLDDLGLVPTLRHTATDRGHRAALEVDFDSTGADRRLAPDLESGLFRIVDDLLVGYVSLRPERITIRLDWSPHELSATIRGHWPASAALARRRDDPPSMDLPPALAEMIEQRDTEERRAIVDARSIPEARLGDIRNHAAILGVTLTVLDDGQAAEIIAPLN